MANFLSIRQILQHIKPELVDRYHVCSLELFGSVVRDYFTKNSDIDILMDFSQPIGIEFIDLADFIED